MKRKTFIVLAFVVIMFAGCGKIWMSPDYQEHLEADARRVAELNERCQAGDDLACKAGLAAASEALDLWVDAVRGVDSSKGGD